MVPQQTILQSAIKSWAHHLTHQNIASNNTTAWGYNLTGLSPNTTYQWSVMTVCVK
ncbi:MAG: hypothetical protein R2847_11530 [Bacteroidia bacterium]